MIFEYNNRILNYNNRFFEFSTFQEENPYELLSTIASGLRSVILTDLRNTGFFQYTLDGSQYFIGDGGNDMFDNGNYTAPLLKSGVLYTGTTASIPTPPTLGYSTTATTITDTDFNYISLGYGTSPDLRPLTILGTRSNIGGPVGFQKAGNIGADGGGSLTSTTVYSGASINGFTVYAFYRQTYGQASDPAICDLYILLGHSRWGSIFHDVRSYSYNLTSNQNGFYGSFGSETKNILAIATLLSKTSPQSINLADVTTIVNNYVNNIKTILGY